MATPTRCSSAWAPTARARRPSASPPIVKAMEKVEAKAKKIAAHQLEASENDIVIENGEFKVTGTDKSIALPMVALAAYTAHNLPDGMEPGLKESAFYDPTNFTFPAGAYICEVEVDPATGKTSFVNFVAADDFGRLINPMIVEGQVHGGLAQGIGQALLEGAVYDASGQLVTASFMDYTMPRADDLPSFKLSHTTTLCPGNPLGVKGCGEAGAIGSSAAVINAITDAIGNNKLEMPATPDRGLARDPRPQRKDGRKIMYETTYHRPSSVDEAAALFAKGSDAKYLAGGHTLIPVMKQRLAPPSDVIDLGKIPALVGIERDRRHADDQGRDDLLRHRSQRRREEGDPARSRTRLGDRRSRGAPSRHASAARSPTTIRRRIIRPPCWRSARR